MLTCKNLLAELNTYLDDEADPKLREDLKRHVNECPNCWVIVDTTKKTLKVYKGMQPQALPVDIENRLMNALAKRMAACKPQA